MLQNRIYRGEIVHKEQSYPGEHPPIIDQPLWDAVQAQLAGNAAQRHAYTAQRHAKAAHGHACSADEHTRAAHGHAETADRHA